MRRFFPGGRFAAILLPLLLLLLAACAKDKGKGEPGGASSSATPLAASAGTTAETAKPKALAAIDFDAGFDGCTMAHRGVLLDLADRAMRARSSGGKLVAPDLEVLEHDGASWASIHGRTLDLSFVTTAEMQSQRTRPRSSMESGTPRCVTSASARWSSAAPIRSSRSRAASAAVS
jgi:hypothetical protein